MIVFDSPYQGRDAAELDEGKPGALARKIKVGVTKNLKSMVQAPGKAYANLKLKKQPQNEKSLKPVCNIDLQKIFALLHAKAVTAAEKMLEGNGVVENTAADGNDPENVVFHSAGEHMIVARAKEEGEKIRKELAVKAIREYVKIFCGADVEAKLNDKKDFFPLQQQDGEKPAEGEPEVSTDEAKAFDMTFSEYLVERGGAAAAGGQRHDQGDDADQGHDAGEDADSSAEGADGADGADDAEDAGDGAGGGDDADEEAEDAEDDEGGDDQNGEGGDDENGQGGDGESAPGYFLIYGLKIQGMKETTAADVLKRWGSNFLKGFGVQIRYFFGSEGNKITAMDFVKAARGLFGAIDDPDGLANEVKEKIQKKFPQLHCDECEFRDKKTVIKDLDAEKRQDYDAKVRQKISSADYSLYVRIEKDNLIQPFMDRKKMANIVTMSIKGLFKAFKHMVKADDVILLRGNGLKKRDEKKTYRLEQEVPKYAQVERVLQKAGNSNVKAYDELEKRFDAIHKNKDHEASNLCVKALSIWDAFKKKYPKGDALNAVSPDPKKAFEEFLKPYAKFCEDYFDEKISVSESMAVAYDIMRSLFESGADFGDCVEAIFEDDPPAGQVSLTEEQVKKLRGAIEDQIFVTAKDAIDHGKSKVKFNGSMAKFARVEVGALQDIDKTEAFSKNGLNKEGVAAAVEQAKAKDYAYFIMAYFKIPKEIKDEDIKGKKKPVSEVEAVLTEAEDRVMKKVKLFFQHDRPELNDRSKKDDALKDEVVQAIIAKWTKNQPSADEVKERIQKYFENPKNFGMTWKGTPGYEGFNENNMEEAFKAALPEGGELFDFKRHNQIKASDQFAYYGTKVPADTDVYLAFTNKLDGVEPPRPPEGDKQAYFVVMKDLDKDPPGDDLKSKDKIRLKYLNDEKPLKPDEVTDDVLERLKQEALGKLTDDEKAKYDFDAWVKDPKKPDEWEAGNGVKPDSDEPATAIYAKFKKKEGGGPGPDDGKKNIYFAVSNKFENPDPNDVMEWLNGEQPVLSSEITAEFLEQRKTEAMRVAAEVEVNESAEFSYGYSSDGTTVQMLFEDAADDADEGDEEVSTDDAPETVKRWEFVEWVPDPTKPENLTPNRTADPHKDAIVICAKFKVEESEGITPEKGEDKDGKSGQGDDLYIIPMPGVKYRNEDEDGFEK